MRFLSRWTSWAGVAGLLAVTAAAFASSPSAGPQVNSPAPESPVKVTVYKSPTCGCCSKWVDHMSGAGFTVTSHDTSDMQAVKKQLGVPADMTSCHTSVIEGYVIEGHVPAADIQKLLRERPRVAGLAVPGMVTGSPGMEGSRSDPYNVIAFGEGKTAVFARH